jgi:diadenosine tetraphosphate (Ap4A) HIT family hydrolase
MRAAKAVHETFAPWKLNYACYGNAEPHVHWHIVPRYADDPNLDGDPWRARRAWRDVTPASEQNISATQARKVAAQIRENWV